METIVALQRDEPAPLSAHRHDLPNGLEPIIQKMMAKRAEDRWQVVGQVSSSLEELRSKPRSAPKIRRKRVSDYRVLTLDCYGTLIDWESGIFEALRPLSESVGLRDTPHKSLRDRVLEEFALEEAAQQFETPTMRYSDLLTVVYRRLARSWGGHASDSDADRFGKSVGTWPPFPDSAESLAYLREHYRLVILSNVDHASFAGSKRLLEVEFHDILTAEDIGSYKPDLRNFQYMLRHLQARGYSESEILHVAQSKFHDLEPATKVGLATAWIDRRHDQKGWGGTKEPPKDARIRIDFHFPSLRELVDKHQDEIADADGGIEQGYRKFYSRPREP